MHAKLFLKTSLYFVGFITVFILGLIGWDYFHHGVQGHHLFARKDLPEISNWWGIITLPLATYILVNRIKKRIYFENDFIDRKQLNKLIFRFAIALIYAIIIAVSFSTGNAHISSFLFKAIFIVVLFIPIYKEEYYLGFMIGLSYTFGGVLPVLIGLILAIVCYLLYRFLHPVFIKLGEMVGLIKES